MRKINRITAYSSLFLAIALLAGCGQEAASHTDTMSVGSAEEPSDSADVQTEPSNPYDIPDDLPEADLNNYRFRIWTFDHTEKIICEDMTGEVVCDAVYESNRAVEERFNVKLISEIQNQNEAGMKALLQTTIWAGDDAFDVAFGHDTMTATSSLEGLFYNLRDLEYLNFDKPWWAKDTVDSLTINGQYYLGTSSISYLGLHWTKCLYVDRDALASYQIDMPYDLVREGKWTFDTLISLTKDLYQDLNGDTKVGDEDYFGFATYKNLSGYVDLCGIETIRPGKDGRMELVLNTPRNIEVIEKLYDWIIEAQGTRMYPAYPFEPFDNGHALFAYARLGDAYDTFRYGSRNYAILPMPKYEESQDYYLSSYFDRLYVVPHCHPDPEKAGLVIEAMNAESYRRVTPVYIETTLKTKLSLAPDDAEMVDTILSHRIMDLSYVYAAGTGMNNIIEKMFNVPTRDFASYYATYESKAKNYVETLNTTLFGE